MTKKNTIKKGLASLLGDPDPEEGKPAKSVKEKKPNKVGRNLKLDPDLWIELDQIAEFDSRSTNNLIETVLKTFLSKAREDKDYKGIGNILFK